MGVGGEGRKLLLGRGGAAGGASERGFVALAPDQFLEAVAAGGALVFEDGHGSRVNETKDLFRDFIKQGAPGGSVHVGMVEEDGEGEARFPVAQNVARKA
jgi:hypothetical protein